MITESQMLDAIAADPTNLDQVLMYCDWLEERGHTHGWIRDCVAACRCSDEPIVRWIVLDLVVKSQRTVEFLRSSVSLTGTPSRPG